MTVHQFAHITLLLYGLFFLSAAGSAQAQKESGHKNHLSHLFGCEDSGSLCAEREDNVSYDPEYKGKYIGQDEPEVAFYSSRAGSGNINVYVILLTQDLSTKLSDS